MTKRAPKRALTNSELEAMRCQCASTRDSAVFEVLRVTGCREHEMLAVRFQDVDLDNKRVFFHKTKATIKWGYKERRGKRIRVHIGSEIKPRWSFLDNLAVEALRTYIAERTKDEGQNFTFTLKIFKINDKTVRNIIKSLAERAKLPDGKQVSPHWLRHTAGTKMLSRGVPEEYIKQNMGWSKKSKTFEETYQHADVDMIQETFERIMEKKEKPKKEGEA